MYSTQQEELEEVRPPTNFRLRDAMLGDGLILNRIADGGVALHAMTEDGPQELGCFDNVIDAWKAIDALDEVEVLEDAA